MTVKTITITEQAYRALSRAKHRNESFSEVVRRLAERSVPLTDFAGAWDDVPETRLEEVEAFFRSSGRLGWRRLKREEKSGKHG
jgi:predicted CopG family antitoxin